MRIKYLGHSSFLITTDDGVKILTDPYDPAKYVGRLMFKLLDEPVDIVTISHHHNDHSAFGLIEGTPVIIRGNGKFMANGVDFLGVETFHDADRGAERGRNTVFIITANDMRIAHLGDLGHVLTADQAAEIGSVDVALVPIGGNVTIDGEQAEKVADQIGAQIVIPMHYRNTKCLFDIAGVDEFLQGKPNVARPGRSELNVSADTLPQAREIVVLEPTL
jgi:L-ascorbate metabolism protein UlaG (beta-lactamase superfamily)